MSQYFKRMAARSKSSLSAHIATYQQSGNELEVHEETVAKPVFTPPESSPGRSVNSKNLPAPPEAVISQTSEQRADPIQSIDQPDLIVAEKEIPTRVETVESVNEVTLQPENIENVDSVKNSGQSEVEVENIRLQENRTMQVNQPVQIEKKTQEILQKDKQIFVESISPVERDGAVTAQTSEPDQQVVEATRLENSPMMKLVEEKRIREISPAIVQQQTPTLVADRPVVSNTPEQQVNIKIGKIDVEVHQPQSTLKPSPAKPTPRSNHQPARQNNLSRYYLRGGLS